MCGIAGRGPREMATPREDASSPWDNDLWNVLMFQSWLTQSTADAAIINPAERITTSYTLSGGTTPICSRANENLLLVR